MSILLAVKEFVETYSGLKDGAPITSDHAGDTPTWYSLLPVPSDPVIHTYISGREKRQFTFAFQTTEYTADELERLENNAFFEGLSDWFKSQSEIGNLPTLDTGLTPDFIEALTWGYLFEEGQSQTGRYQIQCRLVYLA